MAPKNLAFDSTTILNRQPTANVILEMPGNTGEAPSRAGRDDSLGVKTLDEATQTVRDLLAGRSQEIEIVSSTDKSIRKAVADELLASLSRANIEEREQARRLFLDHGYLDDAMRELGTTGLPNERALAARALGLIASPRGILSLVEALLDDAPEVRHAAEQALAQISGPVVANLGALLEEELNFEGAEVVESSLTTVAFQKTPFQNLTIEERMVAKPMSEATAVRASIICLEEEAVHKAMRELKHRLFDAEDLSLKRSALVQKAMQELQQRLLEAEELTRKRIELEAAQRAEVYAARCAEAERALRELEEQREKELALLRSEVDSFQQDLEVVAQQRAGVEELRLETAAQLRQLDEEKAELEAALKARRVAAEELRLESETQIRRFDEETAELEAALEARRAALGEVRLETQDQTRRFDEETAELKAAVEARRAGVEEVRLETQDQIRRFDEETAELKAAKKARRTAAEELRVETEAQIRRFDEEKAELEATVEARRVGMEEVRLETESQIHRLDEEKAELAAAIEARRAALGEVRLETRAQIRRFDEEKAELEAAVQARRAGMEEVRLETESQIRRLDEEKAELAAAVEARQVEAERLRIETERQLSEAKSRSRAEQEQFFLETADLERVTEEVAHRRAEVEASLHQANEEDLRLLEMQQATVQMRHKTAAQMRRLDEEKAEFEAAVEARQAEAQRLRIEAGRQLREAEAAQNRSSCSWRRPTSSA